MFADLMKQFTSSREAEKVVSQLTGKGMSSEQAQRAVAATAEGAAEEASQGGLSSLIGQGGIAGAVSDVLGGGGLGRSLGTSPGPKSTKSQWTSGVEPQIVDRVAATVAKKTGLSADMAKTAVNAVLPRAIHFAKQKLG